ncbi:hypothetical protein MK079_05420 [Candidatus Gracilibacteria bacterium]|nr:hypothetical protein [Candidatus Gracilibacteria bacterium]
MKNKNLEKAYLVNSKTDLDKILSKKDITRLYIGDQECDFNFLSLLDESFYLASLNSGKSITLLLPKFSGKSFQTFLTHVSRNSDVYKNIRNFECCINDYACIEGLKHRFPEACFVNGAYLNHQKRDAQIPFEGEDVKIENSYIKGDFSEYDSYMKEHRITSLDVFNVAHGIKIQQLHKKKNLYYPYIIAGFSRYCYSYNLDQGNTELIIPKKCSGCKGKEVDFEGDIMGKRHYYRGNKYIYSNFTLTNITDSELGIDRIIYNYDLV